MWLTIALLTTMFYVIEHRNGEVTSRDAFALSGEDMAAKAADGDPARRLAIPVLGLFGAGLLIRRAGYHLELRSPLGWLLVGYLVWCCVSILWSAEPRLTIKHVTVLVLCGLAILGIAKRLCLRDLWTIALGVTAILVLNSLYFEVSTGRFRPWDSAYRFAGALHPNVQAPYCAVLAISAAATYRYVQRAHLLLGLLCVAAIVLLVLTKSRTACAALLVGVGLYAWFAVTWRTRVLASTAALTIVAGLLFGGALLRGGVGREASNVALIGRHEESESLSGRVPFWTELLPHVQRHAIFGHGYRTFWSGERIGSFSQAFEWTVTDGHSAYLDTILDLGIIGCAIFLGVMLAGIGEALRRYSIVGDTEYGLVCSLLSTRVLTGALESALITPTSFVTFIVACFVAHLGFCQATDSELACPRNAEAPESTERSPTSVGHIVRAMFDAQKPTAPQSS